MPGRDDINIRAQLDRIEERLQRIENALYADRPPEYDRAAIRPSPIVPTNIEQADIEMSGEENAELTAIVLGYFSVVALFAGLQTFLHWTVQAHVLSAPTALSIGFSVGILLTVAGQTYRGFYGQIGEMINAAGLGLAYITLYVAWLRYGVLTANGGVITTSLVTVATMALALRRIRILTPLIAIAGAYATAIVTGTISGYEILALIYLAAANAAALWLLARLNWHNLAAVALVFAIVACIPPINRLVQSPLAPNALIFCFLTLSLGQFVVMACLRLDRVSAFDRGVLWTAAAAYFFGAWAAVFSQSAWRPWLGSFTLILALAFFGLARFLWRRNRSAESLPLSANSLGLSLLTLAVPLQLSGASASVGWAILASVALWLGVRADRPRVRSSAIGIAILGFARVAFLDTFSAWHPGLNDRLVAYAAAIAMCVYFAIGLRRVPADSPSPGRHVAPYFWVGANLLGLTICSLEVWDTTSGLQNGDLLGPTLMSGVWTIWGLSLIITGSLRANRKVRRSGIALFALAAAKLLLFDLPQLGEDYIVLSFSGSGLLLLIAAWIYFHSATRSKRMLSQSVQGPKQ